MHWPWAALSIVCIARPSLSIGLPLKSIPFNYYEASLQSGGQNPTSNTTATNDQPSDPYSVDLGIYTVTFSNYHGHSYQPGWPSCGFLLFLARLHNDLQS